jgi:hypothetical protein
MRLVARLASVGTLYNTAGLTSPALSEGKRDMAKTTRFGAVLLALVLAAAAMLLALVGPLAKPAKTQGVAPPTLTGDSLNAVTLGPVDPGVPFVPDEGDDGDVTVTPSTVACSATTLEGTISYEASGQVTSDSPMGPSYPGTFTETGTFTHDSEGNIESFEAEFEIVSPIGVVSGTKSAQNVGGSVTCVSLLGLEGLEVIGPEAETSYETSYEATIVTPSSGTFIDRGQTQVEFLTLEGLGAGVGLFGNNTFDSFSETFASDLAQVEQVLPTTKAQCKNGGYEQFGFKNQGACEKAVK